MRSAFHLGLCLCVLPDIAKVFVIAQDVLWGHLQWCVHNFGAFVWIVNVTLWVKEVWGMSALHQTDGWAFVLVAVIFAKLDELCQLLRHIGFIDRPVRWVANELVATSSDHLIAILVFASLTLWRFLLLIEDLKVVQIVSYDFLNR